MEQLSAVRSVLGSAFIAPSDDADDGYWYEGDLASFEVERTDEDEIRVGVQISGTTHDSATLYLQRSEAIRLVLALAASIGDR